MNFIFNYGTSGHRGAWHLADNVERVIHEPKTETQVYEVIGWSQGVPKSKAVEGQEYYKPKSNYWADNLCQRCGKDESMHPQLPRWGQHEYEEARWYPILGKTTIIKDVPLHVSYKADAACGSGTFRGTELETPDYYSLSKKKQYIGKTVKVTASVTRGTVFQTGSAIPPQPFCGHCMKQIEKRYGLSMREVVSNIEVLDD